MLTNILGYPRVGAFRELKKASEKYWAGHITREQLFLVAKNLRESHWQIQEAAGIDLIPCNDFSFYDQVLDMTLLLGAVPKRYTPVLTDIGGKTEIDLLFAMARGYQADGLDITAMEMTKWFDTNYHYIVPEFTADQTFSRFSTKLFGEVSHATSFLKKAPKPVLIGPVSYLLLGKEKDGLSDRIDLLPKLLPVYIEILNKLNDEYKTDWVQLDEPFLVMDLNEKQKAAFVTAYSEIRRKCPFIKTLLTTYFGGIEHNAGLALHLPVCALHLDLVRAPEQLEQLLQMAIPEKLSLSLGLVDGRNIWINDYQQSTVLIRRAVGLLGEHRVMIGSSCSLLHTPFDLELEHNIPAGVKEWMAFARQKVGEVSDLNIIAAGSQEPLELNKSKIATRKSSAIVHDPEVKRRVAAILPGDANRRSVFPDRQRLQRKRFQLPLYPTTTIGSFPQTEEIRKLRSAYKKNQITDQQYDAAIEKATLDAIRWQEQIGLDVLVHGEFERNDMVEYFGEQLEGFLFTQNGWVQSYGSRCVKPPVIYGDVSRKTDMTVRWTRYAQQQTERRVKGMLTGPVTILQWSFVRDDQPRSVTASQIALAIRDEVLALESAGIGIIQIDEPAIREGLPLRQGDRAAYLRWAVNAFRISASAVHDETQIHTHMCYSEFNDIIEAVASMDADVITIETSRSQMELLEAFSTFKYPNEIGPGVYDIHSPRIPSREEMVRLIEKASSLLPAENIWVNPDCGLKTRKWPETREALIQMVAAARQLRLEAGQKEKVMNHEVRMNNS